MQGLSQYKMHIQEGRFKFDVSVNMKNLTERIFSNFFFFFHFFSIPTPFFGRITVSSTPETDTSAFVVDKFGTVIKEVHPIMFQMFKRNAKSNSNEISDAEANIFASRKLKFWPKRIAVLWLRLRLCV